MARSRSGSARDERAKLTDEPERAVTISGPFDD
jgi:hypothetical protein